MTPSIFVRKLTLFTLQITAHQAYFIRRLARDTVGYGALWIGTRLPDNDIGVKVLKTSCQLLPTYPEPHITMCERLLRRGEVLHAWPHANAGLLCAKGRLEQPVLPLIAPTLLSRLKLTASPEETFRRAIRSAIMVAEKTQPQHVLDSLHELETAILTTDPQAKTRSTTNHQFGHPVHRGFPEHADQLLQHLESLGHADDAWAYLLNHRHRFPTVEAVWAKSAQLAWIHKNLPEFERCLARTLILSYTPWVYAPLILPNSTSTASRTSGIRNDSAFPFTVHNMPARLQIDGNTEVSVTLTERPDVDRLEVVIIPPFGYGVTATPNRGSFVQGEFRCVIRGHRPDRVNQSQPWQLRFLVTDGHQCTYQTYTISVVDPSPCEVVAIITDDHELQDGRAETTIDEARLTLVEKLKKCLQIAEEANASWGICLEANSVRLLDWAAICGHPDWKSVAIQYRQLLIDAVSRGHDIGLHIHDFYDPESPHFAMTLSPDGRVLHTSAAVQFTPVSHRPFWHRALTPADDATPNQTAERTKRGSLMRQLALVESLGRLGDPGFRVTLFRAGSYDIGSRPEHWAQSLSAVREADILCDSNVSKGRFYHRFDRQTSGYCSTTDPKHFPADLRKTSLLEIQPEYNTEGDFLADHCVLDTYAANRVGFLQKSRSKFPGPSILTSITHTKFINFRRGLDEYSLDDTAGDWQTIRAHLHHLQRADIPVVRIRDAVDKLADALTPEPLFVREDAIIEACHPQARTCNFIYQMTYLGKSIPVDTGLPLIVVIRPPAWSTVHLIEFTLRYSDKTNVVYASKSRDEIVIWLTNAQKMELMITVPSEQGIFAYETDENAVTLRSPMAYVRAHVSVAGVLHRNVTFTPCPGGVSATVKHTPTAV